MWNIEKDGTINDRFPGDFDKSLDKKNWLCTKCGKTAPSKSNDVFYIRGLDLVYHRDSDGHLYPCMEKGGSREAGDKYWQKPLELNDDIVHIKDTITKRP